jgi:hypothetical protein
MQWVEQAYQLGGRTRYDTSLEIAKTFYPTPHEAAGLATGETYPDGLTGSVLCASRGGPLLLTPFGSLRPDTASYLGKAQPEALSVFGGRDVVGIDVRCELEALW